MENWLPAIIVAGTAAVIAAITGIVKFSRWTGAVDEQRSESGKFMKEIRDDIKEILGRLAPSPLAGGSPLRLTDLGHSISTRLDGKAWASRTAQEMKERIKGMQDYEINDIAFAYINEEFKPTQEQDGQIRSCAYENALKREQVLNVLAVELRDCLLELAGMPPPGSDETTDSSRTYRKAQ